MPVQLFRLRGVPDDEADEIRDLLSENHVDYYETPGGAWGLSMPALWLKDEDRLEDARALIERYQTERQLRIQAEFARLKGEGKAKTLLGVIRAQPLKFIVYMAIAMLVLYLSTKPFLDLIP